MKAQQVVVPRQGEAALEAFEPKPPSEGELLLRSRVSLISPGTERAWMLGLPNTPSRYPYYPGYCLIGEVMDFGSGVQGWSAGDRAACPASHASHATISAARCFPVPAGLSDESAVFFNLTAIAMQGVRKARVELGEPVLTLGAGLIGLLAMQLARLSGALPSMTADLQETRLAFANTAGADAALRNDETLRSRVRELCGTDGASVVIEATGHPDAIPLALELARRYGRVVLLGSTRGVTPSVNFYELVHGRGITLIGAHEGCEHGTDSSPGWWTGNDDRRVALQLLARNRLIVEPLITHRFSGERIREAFVLLSHWDFQALGMLLDWREGSA